MGGVGNLGCPRPARFAPTGEEFRRPVLGPFAERGRLGYVHEVLRRPPLLAVALELARSGPAKDPTPLGTTDVSTDRHLRDMDQLGHLALRQGERATADADLNPSQEPKEAGILLGESGHGRKVGFVPTAATESTIQNALPRRLSNLVPGVHEFRLCVISSYSQISTPDTFGGRSSLARAARLEHHLDAIEGVGPRLIFDLVMTAQGTHEPEQGALPTGGFFSLLDGSRDDPRYQLAQAEAESPSRCQVRFALPAYFVFIPPEGNARIPLRRRSRSERILRILGIRESVKHPLGTFRDPLGIDRLLRVRRVRRRPLEGTILLEDSRSALIEKFVYARREGRRYFTDRIGRSLAFAARRSGGYHGVVQSASA